MTGPYARYSYSLPAGAVNAILMLSFAFMRLTHFGCCELGGPANVLAVVIIPSTLLLSLVLVVRDALTGVRWQAALATLLCVPSLVMTIYAWANPI